MALRYSKLSQQRLSSCHVDLKRVFEEVLKRGFDHSILCGHRDEQEQNRAYEYGYTRLRYPNSKHNKLPSTAIDVVPYPIDWTDLKRICYFAGYVKSIADTLGVNIVWGGDWDNDYTLKDQSFVDMPHFELV